MVGTDKVKGFALTILLVVDSPNTSAVGQRISSGYRVSTCTRSTAHYRFTLDQIYLTGARQHELHQDSTRTRTRSGHNPTPSASSAIQLSGILRLLLVLARDVDRHLRALAPHLHLVLNSCVALVLDIALVTDLEHPLRHHRPAAYLQRLDPHPLTRDRSDFRICSLF
jgi:hypothetical protein